MRAFVTGGAGFIGSNLVDRIIDHNEVTVFDSLVTGKMSYLKGHKGKIRFVKGDIDNFAALKNAMKGADIIFHLAALSDIRNEDKNPNVFYRGNTLGTYNVMEAMRYNGIKKIVFASTQAVYGDQGKARENSPMMPISLYGASKAASEMLLPTYFEKFGIEYITLRLANVCGRRQGKGVVYDFVKKLKKNSSSLEILGDGKQTKSYIHVDDCTGAVMHLVEKSKTGVYNIGSGDSVTAVEIAAIISRKLGLNPTITYTGGIRGWRGDIPKIDISIDKIRSNGWRPRYNSKGAIEKATEEILK